MIKKPWYVLLRYTDKIPTGSAGVTNGFVVRIRPKHKNDLGLHLHEFCHVRQWYRTLTLHGLFYLFSKAYRYNAEIEAYREQCEKGLSYESAAHFIANDYKLNKKTPVVLYDLKYKNLWL